VTAVIVTPTDRRTFVLVGDRLWLDFVNTDDIELGVRRETLAHCSSGSWRSASSIRTDALA
jgi:hypothetical protein